MGNGSGVRRGGLLARFRGGVRRLASGAAGALRGIRGRRSSGVTLGSGLGSLGTFGGGARRGNVNRAIQGIRNNINRARRLIRRGSNPQARLDRLLERRYFQNQSNYRRGFAGFRDLSPPGTTTRYRGTGRRR